MNAPRLSGPINPQREGRNGIGPTDDGIDQRDQQRFLVGGTTAAVADLAGT